MHTLTTSIPEKEIKEKSIYNRTIMTKILRNKFIQAGKRLIHWKLQNTLNEINEDVNKRKDITCSYTGRLNAVEMTTLPKAKPNEFSSESQ